MPRAHYVAVLDLQIRFGVGNGSRREHQIAVEFVGVGSRCGGLDQRIAHPREWAPLPLNAPL